MNARVLIALALVVCAVAVRGEEEQQSALANVETVEPTFLEADAAAAVEADAEHPLFKLPKHLRRTTVEPRYYGEKKHKHPRRFVSPEYRDPKPVPRHLRKNRPVVFTSHYFSPLPKRLRGKRLRVSRQKRGRALVPFRHTVETPTTHLIHKRGYTEAELHNGRLPNKFDDPRQRMKKTKAPAPLSLLESLAAAQEGVEQDTTDEAEADAAAEADEEGPVPPPFQHDEGEEQAVVVESAENFFDQNYQPPTWKDDDSVESELIEAGAELTTAEKAAQRAAKTHIATFMAAGVEIDQSKLPRLVPVAPHVSAEEAVEQYNDLEAFLNAEDAKSASFVEVAAEEAEETEDEDEADEESEDEDEDEAEDEDEEEADDEEEVEADDEDEFEADEESEDEDEADDEADDEAEEEVVEEVSLVETAAAAAADEGDSIDAEMDEMAQNEQAAAQVDMDATSDEAAMSAGEGEEVEETTVEEVDSDEASSSEEADNAEEEVSEDEAVDEAEVADAVSLVEEDAEADTDAVDTLLAEVDSHLASDSDSETTTEAEVEGEQKGTPGSRIAAGQTWEDAQNERLNAMEQQLAAEKAAAPKIAAHVVAKQDLAAVDSEHQLPQYDSAEEQVETVEPELL